jgi:hypothetical protein
MPDWPDYCRRNMEENSTMKKISIIILTLLLLSGTGCKKSAAPLNDSKLLFQMEYVNYAWGYQHSGYLIDGDGNILTFNNPENWNFPDVNYILTGDQVAQDISRCSISGEKVSMEELKKFSAYIDNISQSKVSAIKNTGADAGTIQFICYRYSARDDTYRGTLLKMEGDFTCENLNFYSKKIVSWMKEVGNSFHQN